MRTITYSLILFGCLAAQPGAALAYTGPGLGLGAGLSVIAVLFSVLLAAFAVVWYPLKRLMKRKRSAETDTPEDSGDSVG